MTDDRSILAALEARFAPGWPAWISCGPGWWALLGELDAALAGIDPGYEVHQVKEKFGTLRFYYAESSPDEAKVAAMDALIDAAEAKSALTCEDCGAPGRLSVSAHWWRTVCEPCGAARGYVPADTEGDA